MGKALGLRMLRQPDDVTCGPTCLHAVYRFYGDRIGLSQLAREVRHLPWGGTLAVLLAVHALRRGYRARLYTYNLTIFDPTWFAPQQADLRAKLVAQAQAKGDAKLQVATRAYLEYVDLGGQILYEDLEPALIEGHLEAGHPILTGLSATYLYRQTRERAWDDEYDDVLGQPVGHFVVLSGLDRDRRQVVIADPLHREIAAGEEKEVPLRTVPIHRLVSAILLGVLTYDGNLLVLEPAR